MIKRIHFTLKLIDEYGRPISNGEVNVINNSILMGTSKLGYTDSKGNSSFSFYSFRRKVQVKVLYKYENILTQEVEDGDHICQVILMKSD